MKNAVSVNWDETNSNLVVTEIKKTPENLLSAFRRVAEKLGCSHYTVSNRWYNNIRYNSDVVFKTQSNKKVKVNTKNVAEVLKSETTMIHQTIVDTKKYDGMKVVTIRQYYAA